MFHRLHSKLRHKVKVPLRTCVLQSHALTSTTVKCRSTCVAKSGETFVVEFWSQELYLIWMFIVVVLKH